jgi:3-methylfumaryl-CoA hydratase
MTIDLDHLRTWIGKTDDVSDIITPRLVAEYRATFDGFLAPMAEGAAPLALHWCLAPPIVPMAQLAADGHPAKGGFLPPVPLPNRMWAGGLIETQAALRSGDDVARHSTIADLNLKEGRSGPLCFVSVRHEISSPRGLAIVERHDIVYRNPADRPAASPPPAAPPQPRRSEISWRVAADPVLLFRYSAMTFNGHRIHYDHPYVTGTEGYPGLVIHGPIQATLLFNLAATAGGRVPASFSYRALSPLTGTQTFTVAGADDNGEFLCWTEAADGRICMEARARF